MPANDDDSSGRAEAPSENFHQNFFPESRPPSTITSSVHKKFNLVEAMAYQAAYAQPQMNFFDRVLSWAFEVLVIGLLLILIQKFVRRVMQERNATDQAADGVRPQQKNEKNAGDGTAESKAVSPAIDQSRRVEPIPPELLGQPQPTRDTLRFKSKDFKFVKKRKWVSTGPTMAHGRDLSLSPDKKLFNLRNHHLFMHANPMLNPLPLLLSREEKVSGHTTTESQNIIQTERNCEGGGVMAIKLHIPVKLTIENIYNLKDCNVCRSTPEMVNIRIEFVTEFPISVVVHFVRLGIMTIPTEEVRTMMAVPFHLVAAAAAGTVSWSKIRRMRSRRRHPSIVAEVIIRWR